MKDSIRATVKAALLAAGPTGVPRADIERMCYLKSMMTSLRYKDGMPVFCRDGRYWASRELAGAPPPKAERWQYVLDMIKAQPNGILRHEIVCDHMTESMICASLDHISRDRLAFSSRRGQINGSSIWFLTEATRDAYEGAIPPRKRIRRKPLTQKQRNLVVDIAKTVKPKKPHAEFKRPPPRVKTAASFKTAAPSNPRGVEATICPGFGSHAVPTVAPSIFGPIGHYEGESAIARAYA